jgi:hypothetical protein
MKNMAPYGLVNKWCWIMLFYHKFKRLLDPKFGSSIILSKDTLAALEALTITLRHKFHTSC